jgi:hypothetical protein
MDTIHGAKTTFIMLLNLNDLMVRSEHVLIDVSCHVMVRSEHVLIGVSCHVMVRSEHVLIGVSCHVMVRSEHVLIGVSFHYCFETQTANQKGDGWRSL